MTASEKWLMLTALDRYIKDMNKAERKADAACKESIANRFHENAMAAIELKHKLSVGEVSF